MLKDILSTYADIGVALLKNAIQPYSATGKTVSSIRSEVKPNGLKLFGRKALSAIETGRGPRKSSEYEGFDLNLDDWAKARGLSTKVSKNGVKYFKIGPYWFSAKSLAWKINAKGDKLFRSGGRDVYSDALDRFVEELIGAIKKDKMDEVRKQIKESLNGINSRQTA